MKVKRVKEIEICDRCKKDEGYVVECLGCGRELCYDCREKEFKTFKHCTYGSGSGDAHLCPTCLAQPPEKIQKILPKYKLIEALRQERDAWSKDHNARCNTAENDLQEEIELYQAVNGRI